VERSAVLEILSLHDSGFC